MSYSCTRPMLLHCYVYTLLHRYIVTSLHCYVEGRGGEGTGREGTGREGRGVHNKWVHITCTLVYSITPCGCVSKFPRIADIRTQELTWTFNVDYVTSNNSRKRPTLFRTKVRSYSLCVRCDRALAQLRPFLAV